MSTTEQETRQHIHRVQQLMYKLIRLLLDRCENHDKSKLEEPEKSGFEAMDNEPYYPYGTPEYFDKLERYKPILEHHYKNNPHHPEHYAGFISEMDLLDIMEMLCDWASRRKGLSTNETITLVEQQAERFGFSSVMSSIILNTLKRHLVNEIDDAAEQSRLAEGNQAQSAQVQNTSVQKEISQSAQKPAAKKVDSASKKNNPAPAKPPVFSGLFSDTTIDLSALSEFRY